MSLASSSNAALKSYVLQMYKRIQRYNTDDLQVLDDESSAMMVIVSVIMTAIITPTVTIIYRPGRRFLPYKWRTIQRSKPDAEFRVLVCVHTHLNVPTIKPLGSLPPN